MKSKIWSENVNLFSNVDVDFLHNFRNCGKANSKLTAWSPNESTSRWFKFLLFNRIKEKDNKFFELYNRVDNTMVGNPPFVTFNNVKINLDYLLSIEEYLFITKNLNESSIKTIIEIGPGFGRTAHTLIKLLPNIESYIIIDLPELINLSKLYLKTVLDPQLYKKITFYSNEDVTIKNLKSDLLININSFQEMSLSVIDYYMKNVVDNSKYFFNRNAICKYDPSNVDIIDTSNLLDVLNIGRCQEIIDIYDNSHIDSQIKIYIEKYKPNNYWVVIDDDSDLFSYYHKVLYKKII